MSAVIDPVSGLEFYELSHPWGYYTPIMPGYEVLDVTAHDWQADEFANGTWAIHRPGWYSIYHREMQRPEGRVVLAGSDFANGWSGFIDGAIESGLRTGKLAAEMVG